MGLIKDFLLCQIVDTQFSLIEGSGCEAREFKLEYLGDVMVSTEGMFSTIACITNFMMHFLDNEEILGYSIIIFRRLYNFFPHYRKHLEDPIVQILIAVLKVYKNALTI